MPFVHRARLGISPSISCAPAQNFPFSSPSGISLNERSVEWELLRTNHFHALWGGGVGLRKAAMQARQAFAAAEAADQELAVCSRPGHKRTGPTQRAQYAWRKAEKAMDHWQEQERLWQTTKAALPLFTPTRELNTRGAGGSGAGRDVAAVARQRFRQDQTATAEAGDAELSGPCATADRGPAVVRGSQASGRASGRPVLSTLQK